MNLNENVISRRNRQLEEIRLINLIASYEELFSVAECDAITFYSTLASMHVLKKGCKITKEKLDQALQSIGMTQDEFLQERSFLYRSNVVKAICKKNQMEIPSYCHS